MYCKSCGAENSSTSNYCVNDGALLKSTPIKYRKKEKNSAFCSDCGSKASEFTNYCQNCGGSLIQYGREKNINQRIADGSAASASFGTAKIPVFQLQYIKKAIIPAAIAIIVVLLLSFSMLKTSEKLYDNMLNSDMNNYNINSLIDEVSSETNTDLPKAGKIIGISDVLMEANLQSPDITIKGNGGIGIFRQSGQAHLMVQNGFLIYLLIPFIGLFAAGIFAGRKNRRTNLSSQLYDALGIALLYSIFFTILSFFAGFSYHVNLNVNPGNIILDINTHYSFISTFFMTLLFGFIFSIPGMLFSINFKKMTGHLENWIPYGRAIHQAIVVLFFGFFLSFAGFFIYLTSNFSDFKERISPGLNGTPLADLLIKSTFVIATSSVQFGSYLWNLLNLEPLTVMFQEKTSSITGTGTLSYNIFSGLSATGAGQNGLNTLDSMLSATDIDMYLKFTLLIPIALFIWAGYRISKQPNLLKNLLIFSFVYALIMAGVAAFSDIGFNFSGNMAEESGSMSMNLGFGAWGTFFKSLIFSFVFAYLGSLITKLKADH